MTTATEKLLPWHLLCNYSHFLYNTAVINFLEHRHIWWPLITAVIGFITQAPGPLPVSKIFYVFLWTALLNILPIFCLYICVMDIFLVFFCCAYFSLLFISKLLINLLNKYFVRFRAVKTCTYIAAFFSIHLFNFFWHFLLQCLLFLLFTALFYHVLLVFYKPWVRFG